MPITRNRADAPTLRSHHPSLDGSIASLTGDEFDSDDQDVQATAAREPTTSMLAGYQQPYGAQGEDEVEGDEEDEGVDEGDDGPNASQATPTLPPRGLKEISSLASWTVSTSKPGCGVAALRSPDTSLFWQSDGPQPHLLSIHFFKLVRIAHMRIFLDFDNDESYTPTKMQFLAGTGVHDVQEFCEMTFEQPKGWIDVDFSQVGPTLDSDNPEGGEDGVVSWENGPLLKCFLVQVRIMENHQNGKDTHLRGLQIFARDERAEDVRERRVSFEGEVERSVEIPERPKVAKKKSEATRPRKASWMLEPELR